MLACCVAMVAAFARAAEAALPVVDSCVESAYLDRTAPGADRTLNWDFSFATDPERCIKIFVGQSVHWDGNFFGHPLEGDRATRPIRSRRTSMIPASSPSRDPESFLGDLRAYPCGPCRAGASVLCAFSSAHEGAPRG